MAATLEEIVADLEADIARLRRQQEAMNVRIEAYEETLQRLKLAVVVKAVRGNGKDGKRNA